MRDLQPHCPNMRNGGREKRQSMRSRTETTGAKTDSICKSSQNETKVPTVDYPLQLPMLLLYYFGTTTFCPIKHWCCVPPTPPTVNGHVAMWHDVNRFEPLVSYDKDDECATQHTSEDSSSQPEPA